MMRTLVSGGTGFIGANLARRLIRDGHEVHLLVRPDCPSWRIDGIRDRVRLHEADLTDRDRTRRIVQQVGSQLVFHLAAFGAYSNQTGLKQLVATNLLGTANLLDASVEAGASAFLHAGSSSEYGFKRRAARESDVLEPNSDYAITKAAATHYCQSVARARNVHAVTLRLYSIYGPWEEPSRLMPVLLKHALRGEWPPLVSPSTARDFVYVDDAVDAIVAAAAATTLPRGSVYNVCSGRQTTIAQLVEEVGRLLTVERAPEWSTMPPRIWDTDCWVGSPDQIAQDLGWRATTPLRAGIEATVAWLQEARRHGT